MNTKAQARVHRRSMARLLLGTAMATLCVTAANAQGAAETVTVTGTQIRGAGPTGSNLITVDRAAIELSGAQTTAQLLTTVPQLSNFGGAGQLAGGTTASPTIHSLGNSGSNSTLLLIDGHLIPGGAVDLSIIPPMATQSVEVLPDGASAIYGSDAVAGVINVHTRKNFSGWETAITTRVADHYNGFSFGQLFGQEWRGGGVVATFSYSDRSNLTNSSREFITPRQDLRRGAADPALFTGLPAASTYGTSLQTVTPNGQAVPYPSDGGNFQNFACPVATISTSNSATVSTFAYPYVGTAALPRQTNPTGGPGTGICDTVARGTSLPSEVRSVGFVALHEAINNRLSVNMDLLYTARQNNAYAAGGSVTNVAVFNPNGTGNLSFGAANSTAAKQQTNPFYVGVPGAAANANSEFVTIDLSSLLATPGEGLLATHAGGFTKTKSDVTTAFSTIGLDYDLGGDWLVSAGGTVGSDINASSTAGGLNTAEALLALNGTTTTTGAAPLTQAASSLADTYGLNTLTAVTRTLTTANALDVWNPAGPTNRTNPNVLRSLIDTGDFDTVNQYMQDFTLHADGPIGDFWGAGPIKMAAGGEATHLTRQERHISQSPSAPATTGSTQLLLPRYHRTIYSAYAEFIVPLVGQGMQIPLVQSLTLDIAGRYDHYNDFGVTENPKIALAWDIIDGIRASGSFGTSFTAPGVNNIGDPVTHQNTIASVRANNSGASNGLVVLFNDTRPFNNGAGIAGTWVSNPFACAAAGSTPVTDATGSTNATLSGGVWTNAAGCKVVNQNGTNSQGVTFAEGTPELQPQLGQTYSANLLFDDFGKFWDVLGGLSTQVTYYQAKYSGAITNIGIITSQTNPGLPRLTTFAPANCTGNVCNPGWAASNAIIQDLLAQAPLQNALPATVYSIQDNRVQNAFTIWQNGLDFRVNYRLSTDDYGSFTFGLNGNQIFRASQQNGPGGPIFDTKDGNNGGRFADVEFTGRASLNWHLDPFTAGVALNFQHAYHIGVTTFPYTLPGPGRNANQQNVSPLAIVDLNFGYTLPDNWISGTTVSLNVTDLFDTPPPYVDNTNGYSTGNPIGRMFELGLRIKM